MAAQKKAKPSQAAGDRDVPFEKALAELEQIVEKLEQGEVPLDASLKLYEKGVKAYRLCRKILDRAEKRIQVLVRDADGSLSLKDMAGEGSADEDRRPAEGLFGDAENVDPDE